ncbi:MAG: 3-phosphoserine/phosphohydroxythreonine transaminase [Alkalispirochaetaceae bacterium]
MGKIYNFYAGPAILPHTVLEQIQSELVDFGRTGLSLLEMSHRSKEYDAVHNEAMEKLRSLFSVPDSHEILFLAGGATMQFAMAPINFLAGGRCAFTLTGAWAEKAYADAKQLGDVEVLFDGKESGFTTLPEPGSLQVSPQMRYLHITSNETIGGLQWKEFPETGTVPIIADMSSDILSRPLDFTNFGLIYAGAQKNLGPAGVTVVIVRKDMLDAEAAAVPAYLRYSTHAAKKSLYNTPPVFAIWALGLVLTWIDKLGGLEAVEERNRMKSELLYGVIDELSEFYTAPVDRRYRSDMNVVFRTPSQELDAAFISAAKEAGMVGLKGHRSVGGCRASIYNAMPLSGVETLTDFMREFANKNG